MDLKQKVCQRAKEYTQRDIELARKHLLDVRKMILQISRDNNGLSISDCIDLFYSNLLENIKQFSSTDQTDFYRFRALEYLLKYKNYSSLIRDAIEGGVYCETSEVNFNGNVENDINALFKEYYNMVYVYKIQRLKGECIKNPNNIKLQNEMNRLLREKDQLKEKNFSPYDLKVFEDNQKQFFEKLYKKIKSMVLEDLCTSLNLKLQFMHEMGWIDEYVRQYNSMLDRMYLSSVLRIESSEECYSNIVNQFNPSKMSMQELLALNGFWTNRFIKEVERINESIYILGRTKKIEEFTTSENEIPDEQSIRECLAEYRLVVPYFTRYKLKRKDDLKEAELLEDKRFVRFSLGASDVFSKSDVKTYGESILNDLIARILKLNNYAQLLYDQKDMIMENMLVYIASSNEYANAGYVIQGEETTKSKDLIAIDLKGYNAPIMLHYHKDKLRDIIKRLTENTDLSLYRGSKDFVEEDIYQGKRVIPTKILFPLNKEQRMKVIARAGINSKNRYINHISWAINPKKDMPCCIKEDRRRINLDTSEVTIDEDRKRVK